MKHIGRRATVVVAATAAALGLTTAGMAVADIAGSPRIDPAAARLETHVVAQESQFCDGDDGRYYQAQSVQKGTMSGDERLSGEVTLNVRFLMNMSGGGATNVGKLVVRDPETKRKKVEGDYWSVPGTSRFEGMFVGRVISESGEPDGTLIANFTAYAAGNGVVAEFGDSGGDDTGNPAFIQSGGCPIPAP